MRLNQFYHTMQQLILLALAALAVFYVLNILWDWIS